MCLFLFSFFQPYSALSRSLFALPADARSLAIGKVSINSFYGNKAPFSHFSVLGRTEEPSITTLYSNQFGELNYGALTFRTGNSKLSYLRLGAGELTARDLLGNPTGENFSYYSQGLSGSTGKSYDRFGLELEGKVLHRSTGNDYIGVAVSPELSYEASPFRIGVSFSNLLSAQIHGDDETDNQWRRELLFEFVIEKGSFGMGLELEGEFHERGVEPNGYRAGAEWWINRFLALRLGLLGNLRHTIGFGARIENIQIDYAYLRHAELPNNHYVSLSWFFH